MACASYQRIPRLSHMCVFKQGGSWVYLSVHDRKHEITSNGYMRVPLKHKGPFHPAAQPLSHCPVTWLHVPLRTQCPEHWCLHS